MIKRVNIERSHAVTIQREYRCAGCWNPVMVGFDKDGDWLRCDTDGCNLPGLVSAKWVERQISENEAEANTARKILQDSVAWLRVATKDKLTAEQIMSQLGF
jgi:hypothetical protein